MHFQTKVATQRNLNSWLAGCIVIQNSQFPLSVKNVPISTYMRQFMLTMCEVRILIL